MKRKRRGSSKGWFAICLAAILAGCGQRAEIVEKETLETEEKREIPFDEPLPRDYKGTLTMWSWDASYYQTVTQAFQEKYPNVEFVSVAVEHKDLPMKYQTALVSGGELPDIGWAIIDSRGKVFELDMWEPLEQEPYNFDLSQVYEYLRPHMVNSKGNVCGIEQSLSPAGLAYRKDLAKKYLGTDDPDELEQMMPDWDSFIEKGREVYEKSAGNVYMMFSLGDVRQFIQEQQETPWVDGTEIDVEKNFGRTFRLMERFREANVSDSLIAWTPAWNRAFSQDKHIFATCASWAIKFTIETHDTRGQETGHWGMMSAPEGNVSMGGTAMGITKTCKDKRLAWEFLKFATLSVEGAKAINSMGLMTAARQPYEEEPGLKNYKSAWFGEQDVGVYYMDKIIPNIKTRIMTEEDGIIHSCLSLVMDVMNEDRSVTCEEALLELRKELAEELPDFNVK
ncbi:extracellular solute-binding protein [Lachnospiraceae bacterium 45-W7]